MDEVPGDEVPGDEVPGDEVPGDEVPGDEVRVLVLADRQLVGEAVVMALTSRDNVRAASIRLPDSASAQRRLSRWATSRRADVGLLLCEMTEPGFLTAAAMVIERVPIPWLLLTSSREPRRWGGLMATGAIGVVGLLPMTASLDDLADAIARAASGQTLIHASVRSRAISAWSEHEQRRQEVEDQLARLSPRERSVLDKLARGRSVHEVAADHEVSVGTVRSQVKSILRKLRVTSQLAAVAIYQSAAAADQLSSRRAPARSPSA